MPDASVYLAIDLGAGSGRVIAGILAEGRLTLEEVHRFENNGVRLGDGWHWNLTGLYQHIVAGLTLAGKRYGDQVKSVGVDTWGVDYGLVDSEGRLLGLPHQYRDSRTEGMIEAACRVMPARELYAATGNQFMFYNTLFQLYAEKQQGRSSLQSASRLLFLPDLLNFWLCGVQANETTIASTGQLLDARSGQWSWEVIDRLGLPRHLFQNLVQPGTDLGPLRPHLAAETGLRHARLVTVGAHDTASAVYAVPSATPRAAYVSSGTWSLMGVETPQAVISEASFQHAFTNEGAVGGGIRLLKILCGMWLVQECKRVWDEAGESRDFVEMDRLVVQAPAFTAFIDPDEARFASPGDMPTRIRDYCRGTGQAVPEAPGTLLRVIYESLALKYTRTWQALEQLLGHPLDVLHIVGGGSRNRLLNQMAADALGKPVVAGPVEATAVGNVLVQAVASGEVSGHAAARSIVRASFETETFSPQPGANWQPARERFQALLASPPPTPTK